MKWSSTWGLLPTSSWQMMAAMSNQGLCIVIGMAIVVGCAEQKAAPEPQLGPPSAELEDQDREDAAESKAAKSADSESTGADEKASAKNEGSAAKNNDEGSAAKSEASSKSESSKPSCPGLKKKDCEVTVGCAWSTDKVCVNQ